MPEATRAGLQPEEPPEKPQRAGLQRAGLLQVREAPAFEVTHFAPAQITINRISRDE
jgi:hypothetical protein